MTKEEFISLIEEELESLEDAVSDEIERDHQVNGFLEAYTQQSAAACSNILCSFLDTNDDYAEGDDKESRKIEWTGTSLMITHLQESMGFDMDTYIVSLVNRDTMEDEKVILSNTDDVIKYSIEKWFNVHYDKNKNYDWYYKDGEYSEDIIDD